MIVASYNIHRCIGNDGRYAPKRILDVITELNADVIALQEVESSTATGFDMLGYLANASRMLAIAGPTLARGNGHYGNALLTRFEILAQRRIDISVGGREPRGAIEAVIKGGGHPFYIVATHLGLWPSERRQQVKHLLSLFKNDREGPALLLGDLNEWFLWGRPLRWLKAYFQETPAPNTFPARRPLFALDRIWVRPGTLLRAIDVHDSALARMASDHLPLKAHIACELFDEARAEYTRG